MAAYYNELDPFAAAWLRNLIAAGHIAPGEVDERSILEVRPDDLRGFTQCHFFAGIGVWSYAMRSAGWADDRPVWSGSCPCQPFSAAGKGNEFADERHLWPAWFRLIRECRPVAVFGEQVASKDALAWLDHVSTDLEGEGYAVGAVDTCAAGFGAPHIRQRLYFVADSDEAGRRECSERDGPQNESRQPAPCRRDPDGRSIVGGADGRGSATGVAGSQQGQEGVAGIADDAGGEVHGPGQRPAPGAVNGFWANADWIPCRDGKARPVEPGSPPLAYGAPNRVGRLRGYGNAICAPQAREFVMAFMEIAR